MKNFIEILKAIVFGIVEGITEWLPVSSTGHMIVLEQFFGFTNTQGKTFFDFFLVIIQLGAILAVVINFFPQLWPFGKKKSQAQKREIWRTWLKILVASIPAGVIGVLFDDWLDAHLYNYLTVSITLIVYGIVFLVIEAFLHRRAIHIKRRYHLNRALETAGPEDESGKDLEYSLSNYPLFKIHSVHAISLQQAMIIGLAQALALIPGTSRSGVTICAALLLSINRSTAAQFSFYLSIPAMLGGSLIKGIKFVASGSRLTGFQFGLIIIGMAVALLVSIIVIRFFMKMLRTRTFTAFGIYRVVFGVVLLTIFFVVNKGDLNAGIENQVSTSVQAIQPMFSEMPNLLSVLRK